MQLVRRFRGKASVWFGRLDSAIAQDWSSFRGEFSKSFGAMKLGTSAATKLKALRQEASASAADYALDFERLAHEAGLQLDSGMTKDWFVAGLRAEVQPLARAQESIMGIRDLMRYAAVIDEAIPRRQSAGSVPSHRTSAPAQQQPTARERPAQDNAVDATGAPVCNQCKRPGHRWRQCPQRQPATQTGTAAPAMKKVAAVATPHLSYRAMTCAVQIDGISAEAWVDTGAASYLCAVTRLCAHQPVGDPGRRSGRTIAAQRWRKRDATLGSGYGAARGRCVHDAVRHARGEDWRGRHPRC